MTRPLAIGPHALMPSKLPRTPGVYLICFDAPVSSANGRRTTRHYLGWAHDIRRRIAHHRANLSGSRFMAYVNAAGVGWTVTHLWLDATRADERRLKRQKHAHRLCPRCNPALRGGTTLRELARMEEYAMREEPDRANDPDPDPDPDDSWDSLFVERPTAEGAPEPGAKLIVKGSYGVSYLLTVERVVRGRPLRAGATTEWEIKGTRRPLMPGE